MEPATPPILDARSAKAAHPGPILQPIPRSPIPWGGIAKLGFVAFWAVFVLVRCVILIRRGYFRLGRYGHGPAVIASEQPLLFWGSLAFWAARAGSARGGSLLRVRARYAEWSSPWSSPRQSPPPKRPGPPV